MRGRQGSDAIQRNTREQMTLEVIGVITLVVGLLSIISGLPFVINMFFCSMLFGSAAAFILTSLGGTSILPSYLLLGFLAIKLLSTKDCVKRVEEGLAFGRPGF